MIDLSTKTKRVILLLTALLAVTVYIVFRFFVQPQPPPVSVPPSVELMESKLIGRQDGVRQWEILAKSVLQAGDSVTLTDMDEIIMFQAGEPYLYIDSDRAIWDRKSDILHLHSSVVRDIEGGFRLESDLLIWNGVEKTLTSPGPAFILWEGLEIEAGQMVMEAKNNLLYLNQDVQIRDGSMAWRLENAVYDMDQELMDFYGSVNLRQEARDDE
ncbi:MAG TPA: LPS export ABC transporter periplasmic protein LptC [Firmicutes bacterium]|nr:LPS export ABC transporter periplasmic protein LptC [Bacillota bacterium]